MIKFFPRFFNKKKKNEVEKPFIEEIYDFLIDWKENIDIKSLIETYLWDMVDIKLKDIKSNTNLNINTPMYKALKDDIEKNGLGDYPLPVRVDANNVIMDGNHRIEILRELYEPDYIIKINRSKFPSWIGIVVGLLIQFSLWLWNTKPVNRFKKWAKSLYRSFV